MGGAVNNNSKSQSWLDFKFDRLKNEILLCNVFSKIRMMWFWSFLDFLPAIYPGHTYIRTNITFIYPQIYSVALKANMSETEENKEFIKVKIIIIIIQGDLY